MKLKIIVGHGAYRGANACRVHGTTHAAVMDLIRRGVNRTVARAKVNEAMGYPYPHVTMTTADRLHVIEIGVKTYEE